MELLKPNDVARQLAVSRAWVYQAARTGRIPSVRIGGDDGPLRFFPEDIEQWLTAARSRWCPGQRLSTAAEPPPEQSRATERRSESNGSVRA